MASERLLTATPMCWIFRIISNLLAGIPLLNPKSTRGARALLQGSGRHPMNEVVRGGAHAGGGPERSFPAKVERSLAGASQGERRGGRPPPEGAEPFPTPPRSGRTRRPPGDISSRLSVLRLEECPRPRSS